MVLPIDAVISQIDVQMIAVKSNTLFHDVDPHKAINGISKWHAEKRLGRPAVPCVPPLRQV